MVWSLLTSSLGISDQLRIHPEMSTSGSPAQVISQSSSDQTPPRPRNKRARPPISCLECRRKKLRCDRVQPCMQCKKGGREALCTFVNRPSVLSPQSRTALDRVSPPSSRPRSELATPIQPGDHVQGDGRTGWVANSSRPESAIPERLQDWHNGHKNNASSLGCIHVKGRRSRYLGLSDRMAMLGHVSISNPFEGLLLILSVRGGQGLHYEELRLREYKHNDE